MSYSVIIFHLIIMINRVMI